MVVMGNTAAVVGGGIIGVSIAWRLAQRGWKVTLLDAGTVGGEASWAGAGMLAPGGEVVARSGWAELALESLRLYPEFVRELAAESNLAIDYQQHGALEIAFTPAELLALERKAVAQLEIGIPSSSVEARDLPRLLGPAAGARFYPNDALVDPRDVMAALRAACLAHGVEIWERARVLAIAASAACVDIEFNGGTLHPDAAVLAAGAWSSAVAVTVDVTPYPLPEVFPVRGHLIGYAQPRATIRSILRHGHTYLLQRAGGLLIAGATSERVGLDRRLDEAAIADLRTRASRVMPHLAQLDPTERWLGFRPATHDDAPVIQRAGQSQLWLAYGHYRNGILLAPATAQRIAQECSAS